jgi:uncharacterized membrane protein
VTIRRDDLSRWVSATLLVGGLLSIGIVAVGVLFSLEAVTRVGLVVVVLMPIGRLTVAGAAFLRHRELRYAAASAIVLALLLGGLAIAIATSRPGG